jgi:poly-gamma-glutamate system protein
VRTSVLVVFACIALALAALAERMTAMQTVPAAFGIRGFSRERLASQAQRAEAMMRTAADSIRAAKAAAGLVRDAGLTSADSALIGAELTPLVTTLGSLEAKRLSVSSAWASELVYRLAEHGVGSGDVVAAGFSGSFPGLNLAVAASCEALGARLITVSSVTSSMWGANQPGFTWPEMEARLVKAGILHRVSGGISLGGERDEALDLEPEARQLARQIQSAAAASLGAEVLSPSSIPEATTTRLQLYDRLAEGRRIVLYINVGGGQVSLGSSAAVLRQRNGFLPAWPFDISPQRGLIARFAERGVPVLTLLNVQDLALRWKVRPD